MFLSTLQIPTKLTPPHRKIKDMNELPPYHLCTIKTIKGNYAYLRDTTGKNFGL